MSASGAAEITSGVADDGPHTHRRRARECPVFDRVGLPAARPGDLRVDWKLTDTGSVRTQADDRTLE